MRARARYSLYIYIYICGSDRRFRRLRFHASRVSLCRTRVSLSSSRGRWCKLSGMADGFLTNPCWFLRWEREKERNGFARRYLYGNACYTERRRCGETVEETFSSLSFFFFKECVLVRYSFCEIFFIHAWWNILFHFILVLSCYVVQYHWK